MNDFDSDDKKCHFCDEKAINILAICGICRDNRISGSNGKETLVNGGSDPHESNHIYEGKHTVYDSPCKDIPVPALPVKRMVRYLLFGTYMTSCKAIQMNENSFKMISILPNICQINFKYNITVPFSDCHRVMHCPQLGFIFIETNDHSNNKIKKSMNLDKESINWTKYDVNSNDVIERYIVLALDGRSRQKFIQLFLKVLKKANNKTMVKPMLVDNCQRYIRQYESKVLSFSKAND